MSPDPKEDGEANDRDYKVVSGSLKKTSPKALWGSLGQGQNFGSG